ncbi:hypothetical protein PUW24_00605 (plasmid) [Paenibacillus urinalis]|uniref:Uncharacterized protein n=1 Tax=Paenibacillus urinalis TaxID=521520 RepID=A0ABY7XNQ7_9BACL|nr:MULTISPECIES: hypothetical protein [Paenibacillus]MCM3130584.1 hypothetical protein [Paenibacillus sp. MER 78]WDH95090.1 hypothetical protein PUW24_00605 [Paenibacillus urinalis]WDI05265.1 hypothetical protein PUW25_26960 [Paenibacillus urinalis]
MEKSYYCSEQVGQMQATYDSLVMLKMIEVAGCDIVNNPVNYYCYDWGDQYPVFVTCIKRVFGDAQHIEEHINHHGEEENTFKLPLPELIQFAELLGKEESDRYVANFNRMLNRSCDYLDFSMEGIVVNASIQITLTGFYGILSPFLKVLLEIKQMVQQVFRDSKSQITNSSQNVVLLKELNQRVGSVPEVSITDSTTVVFAQIMKFLGGNSSESSDNLTFSDMRNILTHVLDQVTINRKDDVA